MLAAQVPTGGPPLTLEQLERFSADLQSLARHLCTDAPSHMLQAPVLDRAAAAVQRNNWGFDQAKRDPEGVVHANKHLRIINQHQDARL